MKGKSSSPKSRYLVYMKLISKVWEINCRTAMLTMLLK